MSRRALRFSTVRGCGFRLVIAACLRLGWPNTDSGTRNNTPTGECRRLPSWCSVYAIRFGRGRPRLENEFWDEEGAGPALMGSFERFFLLGFLFTPAALHVRNTKPPANERTALELLRCGFELAVSSGFVLPAKSECHRETP